MGKRIREKFDPNKHKGLKPFTKDDPRINRKGRPRVLPLQKALMEALLGHTDEEDMTQSEAALIVKALIEQAKNGRSMKQVHAAQEVLNRAFGKPKEIVEIEAHKPIVWQETKTYEAKKTEGKKAAAKKK